LSEWLAQQPMLAAGRADEARRQWLAEFPQLAASSLGRALEETLGTERENAGIAPLKDFYHSSLYEAVASRFQTRLAELRSRWRGG
jgi:hypothetical protein